MSDGSRTVIETITREVALHPAEKEALYKLYQLIWTEAYYDPYSEDTEAFARKLMPHIKLLNERWRFKP